MLVMLWEAEARYVGVDLDEALLDDRCGISSYLVELS